jgi:hypothetical protein
VAKGKAGLGRNGKNGKILGKTGEKPGQTTISRRAARARPEFE